MLLVASGGGRGLKIFLIVGIVSAALLACVVVGVVVGVLMTASTGAPRTPCDEIAAKTVGALPYRFADASPSDCVYGYYWDGVCMYDGRFEATDDSSGTGCYAKDIGADLVNGSCYYNGASTCHCSVAYRADENVCYDFAISISRFDTAKKNCATNGPNGLLTGKYCLYEKRRKTTARGCEDGWDQVGPNYCYTRKWKSCDKFRDDGIARRNCLKARSLVKGGN